MLAFFLPLALAGGLPLPLAAALAGGLPLPFLADEDLAGVRLKLAFFLEGGAALLP